MCHVCILRSRKKKSKRSRQKECFQRQTKRILKLNLPSPLILNPSLLRTLLSTFKDLNGTWPRSLYLVAKAAKMSSAMLEKTKEEGMTMRMKMRLEK